MEVPIKDYWPMYWVDLSKVVQPPLITRASHLGLEIGKWIPVRVKDHHHRGCCEVQTHSTCTSTSCQDKHRTNCKLSSDPRLTTDFAFGSWSLFFASETRMLFKINGANVWAPSLHRVRGSWTMSHCSSISRNRLRYLFEKLDCKFQSRYLRLAHTFHTGRLWKHWVVSPTGHPTMHHISADDKSRNTPTTIPLQ